MSDAPPDRDLRVVLADAHETTLAGLKLSLAGRGFSIVGEATTAAGALDIALEERPDLCLLDVDIPGDAMEAAARLNSDLPGTGVVMLAAAEDDENLFAALRAGAQGYLLKSMDADRLSHALRGVVAGEAALPRTLVTRLIEEFRSRQQRRNAPVLRELGVELTEREWEVLEMLREDLSTKAMADRLAISPVTVRRHVSALLHKLGVPDREAAARLLDEPTVQD